MPLYFYVNKYLNYGLELVHMPKMICYIGQDTYFCENFFFLKKNKFRNILLT